MKNDCVSFLQWALPQMQMNWAGFRKVRKQVCKRIRRRMNALELQSFLEYQHRLSAYPGEWELLDEMCRITISRFYRDWAVFDLFRYDLLPQLALNAALGKSPLRCWSAGCASGEEPYTLSLIWHFVLKERFVGLEFKIIATDIDAYLLERAQSACYPFGSLKGLPEQWREEAFYRKGDLYCLHDRFREPIEWIQQDIRQSQPAGLFDLVLCRNLVATYFEPALQKIIFNRIKTSLRTGGILVLGCHEKLPEAVSGFSAKVEKLNVYEKINDWSIQSS